MKALKKSKMNGGPMPPSQGNGSPSLAAAIAGSWSKISPFWPLKNLIAVNPIAGFENQPFEEGLRQANAYFQQKDAPQGLQDVNRESIKWLQAFFDEGQSTIHMPHRHRGFLKSILTLIMYDTHVHKGAEQKQEWLKKLPRQPEKIIAAALLYLDIPPQKQEQFLTLMLTTLCGWAAYIQYRIHWADPEDAASTHSITHSEYLAFRLVLACLMWPEAKVLLIWHQIALRKTDVKKLSYEMRTNEHTYQTTLLKQINEPLKPKQSSRPSAQLVFCIDVRSEPFRRALEAQGDYETFGFAGFFGVPVAVKNTVTGDSHASCPVLLKPAQTIIECPTQPQQRCKKANMRLRGIKKLYQSLKYTFTTPFSLVEALGIGSGVWMGLRTLAPNLACKILGGLKSAIASRYVLEPDIQAIPLEQQISYGAGALKTMGLTENFSPLVIFCGHGSATQNNAYATSLDCGACGGRHGAPNARILAAILNAPDVRQGLVQQGITIPTDTLFVGAQHNTTTDEVEIFPAGLADEKAKQLQDLKQDLQNARDENSLWRAHELGVEVGKMQAQKATATRAHDWAQVRPEWGLARNAAFIVAPRSLTKNINLGGRAFLHSYEWQKDKDGALLTTILTAPMVVAQWINAQYLFSTLDNVAYGGGSKITKNIAGKIGIMQGNGSDLMHGLPLQSVFKSDAEAYHQPLRLTVIVHGPKTYIDPIIERHALLQKFFGNGWVYLICHDPKKSNNTGCKEI